MICRLNRNNYENRDVLPVNICILGQYPPQVGGIATYTRELEDTLKREGHNVYILTYPHECMRKDNVFEVKTVDVPILRGLGFIISGYCMLNKIIDEYDIDVVHANYLLPSGLAASLIHKKGVKIVATAHGSDINILLNNKITRHLIKYTLKHLDDVYFVSEKLQKKALALDIDGLDKKSTVTPNTVNTEKFKPVAECEKTLNEKYKQPIVIFVGNLVVQKGLIYLLKAKNISKTEYTLLIYGDGPEKNRLQEYIHENRLNNTYLMGKTAHPEKIIPEADIMVLPSVSEGASIVALESMACQKPLVVTDSGNISSVITSNENGIIVPIKDFNFLSRAIDELVQDKQKREYIGKNARKLIEKKYNKMKIPYIKRL